MYLFFYYPFSVLTENCVFYHVFEMIFTIILFHIRQRRTHNENKILTIRHIYKAN